MLDGAQEIDQRASHAIDCSRHDDIELPAAGVIEVGIECWAFVSTLGTADALVGVDLDDSPATALRNLPQQAVLVVVGFGLLVCGDLT